MRAIDDAHLLVPDLVDSSWSTRQADAFVAMLKEYLQDNGGETRSSSANYLVDIHVDLHHIEHWAHGGETAVEKLVNEPPRPRYGH